MIELSNYEPADIEIHLKDKGMVLKEKSIIAYTQSDGKILAIGTEAEEIASKHIEGVSVMSPLRQGMIADYFAAVNMFKHMIKKTWGKRRFSKPHIVVCLPQGMTEVEKRALEDVMYQIGSKELTIYAGTLETFREGSMVIDPKRYASYDIFIVIGKEKPEKYITEELSGILRYAAQAGIPAARVEELLKAQEAES